MRAVQWFTGSILAVLAGMLAMSGPAPDPSTSDAHERTDRPPARRAADLDAMVVSAPAAEAPEGSLAARVDASTASRSAPSPALFVEGQRLVRLSDPMDLGGLLEAYDLELAAAPGRSGYALLEGDESALRAVSADPRVAAVSANARTWGSGSTGSTHARSDGTLHHLQWHLEQVDPFLPSSPARDVVVAVLDTGVAYETAVRDGVQYVQAPSLAGSPIVAPYDFIHGDPHANDDHQHGTHIASLIASDGAVDGVAPGVALMPIKVLDEHNTGHELALVEGIWHAIDHGADILNMSLSFGEGYRPSAPLLQALAAAKEAGVVMISASGNDAFDFVTWPAASPDVIAVGSSQLTKKNLKHRGIAAYSNASGAIDVLAPGGNVLLDHNRDGLPDGMLAETIAPRAPAEVGYWLMSGTSQAAAVVSGLAVELVRAGVPADDVAAVLQSASRADRYLKTPLEEGRGTGYIGFGGALPDTSVRADRFYAAVLPYLAQSGGGRIVPSARVTVFETEGTPARQVTVLGSLWGNEDGVVTCSTDAQGVCTLTGAPVPGDGAFAWSFAVEGIVSDELISRPQAALTASDSLELLVRALDQDPALEHAVLAWSLRAGEDPELGPVAESYSVVDTGSGFASIPLGVVMTPRTVTQLGTLSHTTLGLADHEVPLAVLELDGTGFASIPLGFSMPTLSGGLSFAFVDGTGFASIPLGFSTTQPFGGGNLLAPLNTTRSLDGTGFASIPLGFSTRNQPLPGLNPLTSQMSLSGSSLEARLADGGWQVDGYAGASLLSSSSVVGIAPAPVLELDGSGAGVAALD